MSLVRLIFFDVTGTLLKPLKPAGTQYVEAAERYLGVKYDENQMHNAFLRNYARQLKGYPCFGALNQISSPEWWFSVFSKSIAETAIESASDPNWEPPYTDAQLKRAFEHVLHNFQWSLIPGAKETLSGLQSLKTTQNLKLAAVSNSDERTSNIMSDHGILEYFDTVVTSVDAKCAKPDPRIFEFALEKLKMSDVPKNHILHIGNSYKNDYLGATKIGMQAFLLREDDNKNHIIDDAHSIHHISEVLDYVKAKS